MADDIPPLPAGFTLDTPKPTQSGTPPLPPGFKLDTAPDESTGEKVADVAKTVGSQIVRPIAQGAIGALTFIPDIAVDLTNMLPGEKMELPSSYWNRQLDRVTRAPTTITGKVIEGAESMLAGGILAGPATAEEQAAKIVQRGVRTLASDVKPLSRVTTKAAEEAHQAGYSLPPSYIGGEGRKVLQSVSGGPKVNTEFSAGNQEITDNLAKLALGLHPSEELSDATLDRLKDEAYKPFQEIRELGTLPPDPEFDDAVKAAGGRFATRGKSYGGSYRYESIAKEKAPYLDTHTVDAGESLDEIRALRASAKSNLAVYDPEKNALGQTQRQIAQAIEDRMDRYVKSVAQIHPEDTKIASMVHDLKEARSQLAKIANVEASIGSGGHVRARDFATLLDHKTPLTGPLLTIAETAKNFPKALQEVSKAGEQGGWSAVDYLLGGTGILTGHPQVAALSIARPIIRKTLQSESAQRAMINDLRRVKGPAGKAASAVAKSTKQTVSAAAKRAAVGAAILTPEQLGQRPDLGDYQQP